MLSHRRPPNKRALIGTAITLINEADWQPYPTQEHTWIATYRGIGHSVLPGKLINVVILKRDQPIDLLKNRPWYRKNRIAERKHPTQLDVQWMFREMLTAEKIIPTPAFTADMVVFNPKTASSNSRVA